MPVFTDPEITPNDDLVADALGAAAPRWPELLAVFAAGGVGVTWRHYRDGGWLVRGERRGRTVAWVSIEPGLVAVSCYFAERHREFLCSDPGLSSLHQRIAETPLMGRLLPVRVEVVEPVDLELAEALIAARLTAA